MATQSCPRMWIRTDLSCFSSAAIRSFPEKKLEILPSGRGEIISKSDYIYDANIKWDKDFIKFPGIYVILNGKR